MTSDPNDTEGSCAHGPRHELREIKEVLEHRGEDIVIPYSREVSLTPDNQEYAKLFHHVEIRSFEDLQSLTFVPDKLDEKRTLDAIATDDASALAAAQDFVRSRGTSCACLDSGERREPEPSQAVQRKMSYGSDLRVAYAGIRRWQHPTLARLLTEALRANVDWDSPVATHTHRWIDRLRLAHRIPLEVFVPQDVTVLNNATMFVSSTTKLLWAKDIRIHVGGRIVAHSSYTKIRCKSIQGNLA